MQQSSTRLLIVTDYFYPHWTGLSKSLYYMLGAIDTDIPCTVLTVRTKKNSAQRETVFQTPVYREDPQLTISRSQYSFTMLWRFLRLLPSHTTVLVNSPSANVLPFALLTKLFGKKLLIFHQGDLILPNGIVNRLIEKIFDLSSYLSFSLANKVSTYTSDYAHHSRVLKPFLQKCQPVIFPLPEQFHHKKPKKKHAGIRIGFAGRFVEEKGFDILFKAIPLIKKQIPDAQFLYAGEAMPYENFVEKHKALIASVKKDVTFLGLLDEEKLLQFYQEIDFMIVPSRSDCFNLVQAEAMFSGTPCLVSDIPGLRYLVKTSGFGMMFAKDNPHDLADTAIKAVAQQDKIMVSYSNAERLLSVAHNVTHLRTFITK